MLPADVSADDGYVQTLYFCYFFKLNVRFYDVTVQEINTAGICYDTTLKNLVPDNISS